MEIFLFLFDFQDKTIYLELELAYMLSFRFEDKAGILQKRVTDDRKFFADVSVHDGLIEMRYAGEHFLDSCFYEVQHSFYEEDEPVFYIFPVLRKQEIVEEIIFHIEHLFDDTENDAQHDSVDLDFMPTDIMHMDHIQEARAEGSPVLEVEVFFSEERLLDQEAIIRMESTAVYHCDRIVYFPVHDMFFDDEIQEIVLEGVVRSFSLCMWHRFILSGFDLFCKCLAWSYAVRYFQNPSTSMSQRER